MAFLACYVDLGSRRFYAARRVVNLSGDTLDHCTPHYVFVYVERDRADNFPLPFLHSLSAVMKENRLIGPPLLFIGDRCRIQDFLSVAAPRKLTGNYRQLPKEIDPHSSFTDYRKFISSPEMVIMNNCDKNTLGAWNRKLMCKKMIVII